MIYPLSKGIILKSDGLYNYLRLIVNRQHKVD